MSRSVQVSSRRRSSPGWPRARRTSRRRRVGRRPVGEPCGRLGPAVAAPAKPNLVLITMEATRPDHLGCYGDPRRRPRLSISWRAKGRSSTQAIAVAPLTLPSHASMLTGLYPVRHGVRDNTGSRLADSETTLAEHLKSQGYATAAAIGIARFGGRCRAAAGVRRLRRAQAHAAERAVRRRRRDRGGRPHEGRAVLPLGPARRPATPPTCRRRDSKRGSRGARTTVRSHGWTSSSSGSSTIFAAGALGSHAGRRDGGRRREPGRARRGHPRPASCTTAR